LPPPGPGPAIFQPGLYPTPWSLDPERTLDDSPQFAILALLNLLGQLILVYIPITNLHMMSTWLCV
jgi:hypothetical protein